MPSKKSLMHITGDIMLFMNKVNLISVFSISRGCTDTSAIADGDFNKLLSIICI